MVAVNEPEIMTREQLAAWLQVDPHTVGDLVRAGKLPAIYLGPRTIRFVRSEVVKALGDRF